MSFSDDSVIYGSPEKVPEAKDLEEPLVAPAEEEPQKEIEQSVWRYLGDHLSVCLVDLQVTPFLTQSFRAPTQVSRTATLRSVLRACS